MSGRGGDATHVCMAHSLIEFVMVSMFCCASIQFSGARGLGCCSRSLSCWMLMRFSSLNLLRMARIFVSYIGCIIGEWGWLVVRGGGGLWT